MYFACNLLFFCVKLVRQMHTSINNFVPYKNHLKILCNFCDTLASLPLSNNLFVQLRKEFLHQSTMNLM